MKKYSPGKQIYRAEYYDLNISADMDKSSLPKRLEWDWTKFVAAPSLTRGICPELTDDLKVGMVPKL